MQFLQEISWKGEIPLRRNQLLVEALKLAAEKQKNLEPSLTVNQLLEIRELFSQSPVPIFLYQLMFRMAGDGRGKHLLNVYADHPVVLHFKEQAGFRAGCFEIPDPQTAFHFFLFHHLFHLKNSQCQPGNLQNPAFAADGELETFDVVISAPPFGPLYSDDFLQDDPYGRFTGADLSAKDGTAAYMLHAFAHLNEMGKAVLLLNGSPLFQTGKRGSARMVLLEQDAIEGVIALPAGLLRGSSIAVYLLILNKNKPEEFTNKVIFLDAGNLYETKQRTKFLSERLIREIQDLYTGKNHRNSGKSCPSSK